MSGSDTIKLVITPLDGVIPSERREADLEQKYREATKEFLEIKTGIAEQLLAWQTRLAERTPTVSQNLVKLEGKTDDLVPWGRYPTVHTGRIPEYELGRVSPRPRFCEIIVLRRDGVPRTFLWLEKSHHPDNSNDGVLVTEEGLGYNATLNRRTESANTSDRKSVFSVSATSNRDAGDRRYPFPTVTDTDIPEIILLEEGDELEILQMPIPTLSPFGYFYDPSDKFTKDYQPDPLLKNSPILKVETEDLATAKTVLAALTATTTS